MVMPYDEIEVAATIKPYMKKNRPSSGIERVCAGERHVRQRAALQSTAAGQDGGVPGVSHALERHCTSGARSGLGLAAAP